MAMGSIVSAVLFFLLPIRDADADATARSAGSQVTVFQSSRSSRIHEHQRLESGPRMSQAVIANGFVFLAGQVAPDPSANVLSQTKQVLGRDRPPAGGAGSSKDRILSATIYLADIKTFGEMNQAWEAWVSAGGKPARATVEAQMVAPEYRVEIQVTALV